MLDLNNDNFDEYAIRNYRNPNCVSVLEFLDDLKSIKYIKRLLNKYADKGELRERLILNHIIFLSNVFGFEATVRMLRFKMGPDHQTVINTFLLYLEYVDESDEHEVDVILLQKLKRAI